MSSFPEEPSNNNSSYNAHKLGFFALSAELRNKIYEYILPSMHLMRYSGDIVEQTSRLTILFNKSPILEPGQRSTPSLGALSLVSRQFSKEFRSVYFASWEKVVICQGRGTLESSWWHGNSTASDGKTDFERNAGIGSAENLIQFMDLVGKREVGFVRKFVVFDGTAVQPPEPRAEEVRRRLEMGGLAERLEEGQKVHIELMIDPAGGDPREFCNETYRFEILRKGSVSEVLGFDV